MKVPIFLFTLMYNIGVCSMGALNFIFHNSAAGLYVTFINFSITLWQTGLVEEQVRVPGEITDHMLQINFLN